MKAQPQTFHALAPYAFWNEWWLRGSERSFFLILGRVGVDARVVPTLRPEFSRRTQEMAEPNRV